MNHFFRSFFAALLALVVFSGISLVFLFIVIAAVSSGQEVKTGKDAVFILDLATHYPEIEPVDALSKLTGDDGSATPSLYHLTRMIRHAGTDGSVKGIFLKCDNNANDFAASEAIRNALVEFRASGKFVIAAGNDIPQRAYYVATAAEKIYCSPIGGVDWRGFAMTMPFLKGTLDRMEIEPQIFYAGKYKSATEPLRETKMTEANRLQTTEILSDLYSHFLATIADGRKIDSALLRRYADSGQVKFAADALAVKMIDGLRYDDQVKDEIRSRLKIKEEEKINFVTPGKYAKAADFLPSGSGKIAVIYAEGNIVDGKGERDRIGGESYRNIIRKARMDESIKAIVIRINSGGGSAVASEEMWREVQLAKKDKPVVVSFGDVAASGGYYMACGADHIFAQPNTITGSIGVFAVLPNMENFFDHKLGITFDEVKTSPDAGLFTVTRPLSAGQKRYLQQMIDSVYHTFKLRVSEGRGKSMEYVDSIAQGRVWSGTKALQLGLVDKLGGLDDAIKSAAKAAELKEWRIREYPDKPGFFELIKGESNSKEIMIRKELGEHAYRLFKNLSDLQQMTGTAQARLPFDLIIE